MRNLTDFSYSECMPLISTDAMRALDNDTKVYNTRNDSFSSSDASRISNTPVGAGYLLMKEAGQALHDSVVDFLKKKKMHKSVAVFIGGGNNGGDGLVLARLLIESGIPCTAYSLAKPDSFKNEARMACDDFLTAGGKLYNCEQLPLAPHFTLVVDCMLGNGASGELRPAFASVVNAINNWKIPVLAADAPTGFDSQQHFMGTPCIHAAETLLFGLPRLDAYTAAGFEAFGNSHIAKLPYPEELIRKVDVGVYLTNENMIADLLPERNELGDKRTQGTAMIIAGSSNMPGAAGMCTAAALRSGAGLVTLATPKSNLRTLQAKLSEPVFCGLGDSDCENLSVMHLMHLQDVASRQKAIAIGPGLGTSQETQDTIRMFLTGLNIPVVIDADAINACGSAFFCMAGGPANAVVTPHKREWERNFGPLPSNECYYPEYLRNFAMQFQITILLKGSPTYVALTDGRVYVIPARNSGLAKGGSGDILTGIIVSLLSQGMPTGEATVLGALIHQKAGRITREELGPFSMLPTDVINNLHKAFC